MAKRIMDMDNQYDKQMLWIQQSFFEHYEGLHHYAFTLLKDNESAREAVHTAFSRLWGKLDTLDKEQSIKSHLYTEVYDYCLNTKISKKIKACHTSNQAFGYQGPYTWGNKNIFIQA